MTKRDARAVPGRRARHDSKEAAPQLVQKWLYNIENILEAELAALQGQLEAERHDNPETQIEINQILNWLLPPVPPLSKEQKTKRANEAMHAGASVDEVIRIYRSTGRRRGRPRTDTAQHAIAALSLHLSTSLGWGRITYRVKGCNHTGSEGMIPGERSCRACSDAIRDAVGRLEDFLRDKGYHPNFSRWKDVESTSKENPNR